MMFFKLSLIFGLILTYAEDVPHFVSIQTNPEEVDNWIQLDPHSKSGSLVINIETKNTYHVEFSLIPTGTNTDRKTTHIGSLDGHGQKKNSWEFAWYYPKGVSYHDHLYIKICDQYMSNCQISTLNVYSR